MKLYELPPTINADKLAKFADSPDEKARATVANASGNYMSTLSKLSKDESLAVRSYVARNPETAEEILKSMMIEDVARDVRDIAFKTLLSHNEKRDWKNEAYTEFFFKDFVIMEDETKKTLVEKDIIQQYLERRFPNITEEEAVKAYGMIKPLVEKLIKEEPREVFESLDQFFICHNDKHEDEEEVNLEDFLHDI